MAKTDNPSTADLIARAGTISNPQGSLAELLAKAAEASIQGAAPAWNPNAELNHPLTISGLVDDMDVLTSDFGPYPVVTLDTQDPKLGDNGRLSVHGFHTALKNQLRTVAIGDIMAVTYLGVTEQKNKKAGVQGYENYNVTLLRPDGTRKSTAPQRSIADIPDEGDTHPTVVGPGGASAPRTASEFGDAPPF